MDAKAADCDGGDSASLELVCVGEFAATITNKMAAEPPSTPGSQFCRCSQSKDGPHRRMFNSCHLIDGRFEAPERSVLSEPDGDRGAAAINNEPSSFTRRSSRGPSHRVQCAGVITTGHGAELCAFAQQVMLSASWPCTAKRSTDGIIILVGHQPR